MSESVIVNTRCGKLRGSVLRSFEDYNYCAFKGIPYAKPPVGKLRFKDPIPAEPWSGIRDAKNHGPSCGQITVLSHRVIGSDDCLYLNVYVRSINPENRRPVMFWIHGGAYIHGSGDDMFFGPDYFLKKDIVLVTCNYRVGVLGFLTLDDEVAPGNQGLKDQIMALKWVQQNITNFGGDENNVTIFGESAGGASVHYLAMSPVTKGLFHKAISQSGVAANPFSYGSNVTRAYELCKLLGKESTDPKEILEFLQIVELEKLIKAQHLLQRNSYTIRGAISFCPGIDDKSKEPVVPIHPLEAMENGIHLPYIIGCTDVEGLINAEVLKNKEFEPFSSNFEYCISPCKKLLEKFKLTENDVRSFYFGNEKICEKNIEKFIEFWGDLYLVAGIHRVVATQVNKSSAPTYFYRFCYDKEFSLVKSYSNSKMQGAAHFDEVLFQFSMNLPDKWNIKRFEPGTKSYRLMEQMIEMWVNFAIYGRPTTTISELIPTYWLPVTNNKTFQTLNINEELRMENVTSIEERILFDKYSKHKL